MKKNAWIGIVVILILATLLRVWSIDSESYWLDEAISIRQAQEKDYATTLDMVQRDVHLPLYITMLHFWVKLFGTTELATRLLSLLFGVASVWVCFALTKKLFSQQAAIIASTLFAISPIMIYYSQEARLYSLFVLLTLLSFYYFVKLRDKPKKKDWILYGMVSLLLIYTHLFAFLIIIVQNCYMILLKKCNIKRLGTWIGIQFVLFISFTPWLPNLFKQVSSTLNTMWIPKPAVSTVAKTAIDFAGNFQILLLFVVCIITYIVLRKYKSEKKHDFLLLIAWICIPFAIVLTYSYVISPVYHTRYMLFTLPAILMLFSVIIESITKKRKILQIILLSIILVLTIFSVASQANSNQKDEWKQVVSFIKENTRNNETVFINPFYHNDPFTYYYDHDCFTTYLLDSCNYEKHRVVALRWDAVCCNETTPLTATDGKNKLSDYLIETIWLVSVREELYGALLFDYLNQSMSQVQSLRFGEIKVYKFEKRN